MCIAMKEFAKNINIVLIICQNLSLISLSFCLQDPGSSSFSILNLIMSLSLDLRLLLMTPRHRSNRVKPLDPGTFLLMAQATTGLSSSFLFNY